jgi:broad specificity phosphatase PhoE
MPAESTTLVFVRHGESTAHVRGNVFCGELDPPLSPLGLEQAAAASATLLRLAPRPEEVVWVSPRRRTLQTVERALPGVGYEVVEDLRELSFGAWEGMTKEEARAATPSDFDAWDRDSYLHAAPGGESGEAARPRMERVIDRLVGERGRTVVVVSHTTYLRFMVSLLVGIPPGEARRRLEIVMAGVGVVELEARAGRLKALNL